MLDPHESPTEPDPVCTDYTEIQVNIHDRPYSQTQGRHLRIFKFTFSHVPVKQLQVVLTVVKNVLDIVSRKSHANVMLTAVHIPAQVFH